MRGELAGSAVLDLYAGSGAVGLESASRGATQVLLVEREPRTVAVLRANAAALALPGVEVRAAPVHRLLAEPPVATFDIVFLDPPYADSVDTDLDLLLGQPWLSPVGLVVVERSVRSPELRWPAGLVLDRSRRYGDTVLWYGRRP